MDNHMFSHSPCFRRAPSWMASPVFGRPPPPMCVRVFTLGTFSDVCVCVSCCLGPFHPSVVGFVASVKVGSRWASRCRPNFKWHQVTCGVFKWIGNYLFGYKLWRTEWWNVIKRVHLPRWWATTIITRMVVLPCPVSLMLPFPPLRRHLLAEATLLPITMAWWPIHRRCIRYFSGPIRFLCALVFRVAPPPLASPTGSDRIMV